MVLISWRGRLGSLAISAKMYRSTLISESSAIPVHLIGELRTGINIVNEIKGSCSIKATMSIRASWPVKCTAAKNVLASVIEESSVILGLCSTGSSRISLHQRFFKVLKLEQRRAGLVLSVRSLRPHIGCCRK